MCRRPPGDSLWTPVRAGKVRCRFVLRIINFLCVPGTHKIGFGEREQGMCIRLMLSKTVVRMLHFVRLLRFVSFINQ